MRGVAVEFEVVLAGVRVWRAAMENSRSRGFWVPSAVRGGR